MINKFHTFEDALRIDPSKFDVTTFARSVDRFSHEHVVLLFYSRTAAHCVPGVHEQGELIFSPR